MGDSDFIDGFLGLMANFLQTFLAFVAVVVFIFFSEKKQADVALRVIRLSKWAASHCWMDWLRSAGKKAYVLMGRYYGVRERCVDRKLFGFLSDRSWYVSVRLATFYLTIGLPILGFLYLAMSPKSEVSLSMRMVLLGVVLVSIVAVWVVMRIKKRVYSPTFERRCSLFFRSLIVGVAFPAVFFSNQFISPPDTSSGVESLEAIAFIVGVIATFSFSYLYSTLALIDVFGRWLPVGLLLYLLSSVFVQVAAGNFPEVVKLALDHPFLVPFRYILQSLGCFFILIAACLGSNRFSKLGAQKVFLFLGFIGLIFIAISFFSALDVLGVGAYFDPIYNGRSFFSIYSVFGAMVVTVASIVYSNGFADWVSVGVTRFLLIFLVRAKSGLGYVGLIAIDMLLAIFLCLVTYYVFVGLVSLYYNVAQLDIEGVLDQFLEIPFAMPYFIENGIKSGWGLTAKAYIGRVVGLFVFVFSFTALVPTLFHVLVTIVFVLVRVFSISISKPAVALLERHREVVSDGEASKASNFNYGITVFFITISGLLCYSAYKAVRMYLSS